MDHLHLVDGESFEEPIVTSVDTPCPKCKGQLTEKFSRDKAKNQHLKAFFVLSCPNCNSIWNVRLPDEEYA